MKIERRNIAPELRIAQEGTPTITGYAAVFDSPSNDLGWTEEIDPHAFDTVMATDPDVRCLNNHDPNFVLGRTKSGTLSLSIDTRGLAYTVEPPATTFANDLIVSMRRGDITQSSFSFITARDQWTDNPDGTVTRRILEFAELYDVSIVTYPAYDDASAGVRSLPDSMPREMRSRFERRSKSDDEKTKRVDGEDLTADCFLIVGDPDKTDTWHLPWKFSTDAKTKSHLRDALARIDQVEGVSDAALKSAKAKLLKLCKEHDIDVSEEKSLRALTPDECTCTCAQCMTGAHGICSAEPQCDGAERGSARAAEWLANAELRIRLAEAA